MTTPTPWYRWTRGPRGLYRSIDDALAAWAAFNRRCNLRIGASAQTVTAGNARLYACATRRQARSIDVSRVRRGERIVQHG